MKSKKPTASLLQVKHRFAMEAQQTIKGFLM